MTCVEAGGVECGYQLPLVGCHMVRSVVKMIRLEEIDTEGAREVTGSPEAS